MPDDINRNLKDQLYENHHNIIDGIYSVRHPEKWEDIPRMDKVDEDDEDDELYALYKDVKIIDIEDIPGLVNPSDEIDILDYVFILRREGQYYICETQGKKFIKFASNISHVEFIKIHNRTNKIIKLYGKDNLNISK